MRRLSVTGCKVLLSSGVKLDTPKYNLRQNTYSVREHRTGKGTKPQVYINVVQKHNTFYQSSVFKCDQKIFPTDCL